MKKNNLPSGVQKRPRTLIPTIVFEGNHIKRGIGEVPDHLAWTRKVPYRKFIELVQVVFQSKGQIVDYIVRYIYCIAILPIC